MDKLLEIIEELGKIPMETIDNLDELWSVLESMDYNVSISPDTNYLIVE